MDFEILAEGLAFPEGPVMMDDGSIIVVEIAAGRITRVARDGGFELGVAGYVVYYMRSVLPGLERAAAGSRGGRSGAPRPPKSIPGDAAHATPRPVATTSRRDARRDRKRKSK